MWPNQLAVLLFILFRMFLTSLAVDKVFSWLDSSSGSTSIHCWGLNILHPLGLFWKIINPSQRILPDNMQQLQENDNPAPTGIQTHNTSKRGAADSRLRPSCHRDRRLYVILQINKFLFNKNNRRTNFPNLFCQEILHVSGSFSVHHHEFSTVHSALLYVMQVCWQLSSTTILVVLESCHQTILVVFESYHQTCMTYTSAECTVENSWLWAEELPETCRVSWQNKFGKLVRLLVLIKINLLRCTVTRM
jgi:hypothetical protein